jgi:putative transposase
MAAGILKSRKKSIKRGNKPKDPHVWKPVLKGYFGFKILDGVLKIPTIASGSGHDTSFFDIPLNEHVSSTLKRNPELRVRSFTISAKGLLSLSLSKDVETYIPNSVIGIDRNLTNVSAGNRKSVIQYDLSMAVDIAENSRSINRAFKRNDARVGRLVKGKNGKRQRNRINQLLHGVSKSIVNHAKDQNAAIVFEDITHIRNLYRRGNGQSRDIRAKMNSWSFYELKRQIEYKAVWEGVPIIKLTKGETKGTSKLCYQGGERLQDSKERHNRRKLWCNSCRRWLDRDIVAVMNISYRGWSQFDHPKGAAGEAMVKEPGLTLPAILLVDAAKLSHYRKPKT